MHWQHRYHDREDLIDALLASAHFPGLVDWKPIASFRGRWCHDGSFLGSASRVAVSLQQAHPHTLVINYEDDANLRQPTFLQLGNLLSMEGVRQLFAAGEKHAAFLIRSSDQQLTIASDSSLCFPPTVHDHEPKAPR